MREPVMTALNASLNTLQNNPDIDEEEARSIGCYAVEITCKVSAFLRSLADRPFNLFSEGPNLNASERAPYFQAMGEAIGNINTTYHRMLQH